MFHERNAMGGGSPYVSGPMRRASGGTDRRDPLIELAGRTGRLNDPRVRDLIGEARTLNRAGEELSKRIAEGMGAGVFPDTTAAIARLMSSVVNNRHVNINLELAGTAAIAANEGDVGAGAGMSFLMRQSGSIGGGTTEMARNNVSERVLGMPREMTHDRNLAFRDVPKGPPSN
jgi:alkylation response protein AidB-like acyl-CoA dehydrogenase